jgi:diphthamide synthase subunit DPH2
MKKSAHEVYKLAKEQNLTEQATKDFFVKEGIIVNLKSLERQHEIAENIKNKIKKNHD